MWKGPEEGGFYLGEIRSVYVLCRIRNYNMGFFNTDASYNYSGNIVWKGRSKGVVPRGRTRAHTFFFGMGTSLYKLDVCVQKHISIT